jgi:hypothetical protein
VWAEPGRGVGASRARPPTLIHVAQHCAAHLKEKRKKRSAEALICIRGKIVIFLAGLRTMIPETKHR